MNRLIAKVVVGAIFSSAVACTSALSTPRVVGALKLELKDPLAYRPGATEVAQEIARSVASRYDLIEVKAHPPLLIASFIGPSGHSGRVFRLYYSSSSRTLEFWMSDDPDGRKWIESVGAILQSEASAHLQGHVAEWTMREARKSVIWRP